MKQQANKGRSERELEGGFFFWKLQPYRQSFVEKRSVEKLSPRFHGPYKVIARVGHVAYTLKLLESSKIYPTLHVSMLKKCPVNSVQIVHVLDSWEGVALLKESKTILSRRMTWKRNRTVTDVLVKEEDATWMLRFIGFLILLDHYTLEDKGCLKRDTDRDCVFRLISKGTLVISL